MRSTAFGSAVRVSVTCVRPGSPVPPRSWGSFEEGLFTRIPCSCLPVIANPGTSGPFRAYGGVILQARRVGLLDRAARHAVDAKGP
ncbi:hypothetical protein ACFFX0_06485 [Citricoccus parietis]|uniref:Uncharacterized protein n=1 Tax=Citricoccus parietis TaxID=592307 RepID=A0ABV5FVZ4_9MICC